MTIIAIITVNMAFLNFDDFQAALNACVSVQDWKMLTVRFTSRRIDFDGLY